MLRYATDPNYLLQRFQAGDMDAMETLYSLHYKSVWYFANRLLQDPEQAEDIVTESFVKLWERRLKFDSLKGIAAFLFLVTRNACYGHLKQAKRHAISHKELIYLNPPAEDIIHTELVRGETLRQVLLEAESLPPKMKKVFKLLFEEGLSLEETARELGLSIHTVIAQRANAIGKLKTRLAGKGLPLVLLF